MDGDHFENAHSVRGPAAQLASSAAQLNLELGANSRTWQTEELLKHPQVQTITISNDVSYKRDMSYRAVPLAALLTGIKPDDHLQAVALDGFAAEMAAAPLLNTQGARAWLAIEDPAKPWPPLSEGKPSAGPFYLVWTDPQAATSARSNGRSRWPASSAMAPVAERFPALLPDPCAEGR